MSYLPPRPRTLADVVSFSSAAQAHSRALVCCQGGPSLSRAALARAVADAVASLKALGVSPGDVVTIVDVNTVSEMSRRWFSGDVRELKRRESLMGEFDARKQNRCDRSHSIFFDLFGPPTNSKKNTQVDFVVAFLAVACARAVAAPLNAAYKQDEFKFYIEDAKSKLVLLPASGGGRQPEAAAAAAKVLGVPVATCGVSWGFGPPPVFVTTVSPAPGANLRPLSPHTPKMEGTAVAPLASLLADPPHPSDVALFLHTSGTTSRPKGVPLTHGNLACSLTNIAATYELDSEDCSYLVMPLFHVHGLMAGLLAPLAAGGAVALPAAGRFAASAFWGDVAESRATFYTAVPTMHQVLLSRSGLGERRAAGAPRLRFVRSCSSALAAATLEKVEALAEAPCLEAYAMTEASHQMTSNPLPKHGERRPGTVGRPQGGVSVAVLAPDNTVIRVPGQIGEICIRGDNVTAGYLNNPEATREAFAGGWFHTVREGERERERKREKGGGGGGSARESESEREKKKTKKEDKTHHF